MTRPHGVLGLVLAVSCASIGLIGCSQGSDARADGTANEDWPAYGRDAAETRFTPLAQINAQTAKRLGLAWSLDLPNEGALQGTPLAIDGTLYFSGSNGRAYAVNAETGQQLWQWDPDLEDHWQNSESFVYGGNRGLAYSNGKIYVGTIDGRLNALDAKSGKLIWAVNTFDADNLPKSITGAPRVCDGKVIIGFRGSSGARGYVTAYDANTGAKAWRFFTVPGNPALGFENEQMAKAAKTWSGQWWKFGGNGSVWDGITCDPELGRVYIGTADAGIGGGSGKSDPGEYSPTGDMLYQSSFIALDANTGKYIWHQQIHPHMFMQYEAATQMILADLVRDRVKYKVLMAAPKNGFFYVFNRTSGRLLSADKFENATWSDHVDAATGLPMAREHLQDGKIKLDLYPTPYGAHSWQAMSFNPNTGLVYIPIVRLGVRYGAAGGLIKPDANHSDEETGGVEAWDPVARKVRWVVRYKDSVWNGGTLTTAGNLVVQGTGKGRLYVYDATNGKLLWSFDAGLGIIAPPISYSFGGRQYISVLVGFGMPADLPLSIPSTRYGWHFNEQPRRVLTFALDAKGALPSTPPPRMTIRPVDDPALVINKSLAAAGAEAFRAHRCFECHGWGLENYGSVAPDLRESQTALNKEAFRSVVQGGALSSVGMPKFQTVSDSELDALWMYIRERSRAAKLQSTTASKP